jgi:hypothetical protein
VCGTGPVPVLRGGRSRTGEFLLPQELFLRESQRGLRRG